MRYIDPVKWMQVRSIVISGMGATLLAPLLIVLITPHIAIGALIPLGVIVGCVMILYLEDCSNYTRGRGQFVD